MYFEPDPLPDPPPVPKSYVSNFVDRIDSPTPMSAQEQITLLFELEQELDDANDGGTMLQVKKPSGWRDWVGMATFAQRSVSSIGRTFDVQIGAGKWADQIGAGAVSLFLLWPLAISAGYGAWEQMKMPDNVFDFIGTRLSYSS